MNLHRLPDPFRLKLAFEIDYQSLGIDAVRLVTELFREHIVDLTPHTVRDVYKYARDLFVLAPATKPACIVVVVSGWDSVGADDPQMSLARTALACLHSTLPMKLVCITDVAGHLASQFNLPTALRKTFISPTSSASSSSEPSSEKR